MGMTEAEIAAAQARMRGEGVAAPSSSQTGSVEQPSLKERIRQRKGLHILLWLLLGMLLMSAVQAGLIPFLDGDNSRHSTYRFGALFVSFIATLMLMPELDEQPTWLRGFALNAGYAISAAALLISAAVGVWLAESHFENQKQLEIAQLAAQEAAEKEAQRLAMLKAQQAERKARVASALDEFSLPFNPSACDWGKLPEGFSEVSYRHKIKARYQDRNQRLHDCLQQEMNHNFDAYTGFLTRQIGGAFKWNTAEGRSSSWSDVPRLLDIVYPKDVCQAACAEKLETLKQQVGEVAQTKADAFGVEWERYMRVVVAPAIKLGDELDWEIEREAREEKAAEEAYRRQSDRALREADGGFSEFIRGVTQASNEMARKTESQASRYQRMVDENARYEGAKNYWSSRSGIILDSTTTEPAPPPAKQRDCLPQMGFRPDNADEPVHGAGLEKKPICKAAPAPPPKGLMCPVRKPGEGCAKRGYGTDHCDRHPPCKKPPCSCGIQK